MEGDIDALCRNALSDIVMSSSVCATGNYFINDVMFSGGIYPSATEVFFYM